MSRFFAVTLILFTVGAFPRTVTFAADDSYGRPRLLVQPLQLARAVKDESMIVLDARGHDDYLQQRVPGARWVDHAQWSQAFGDAADAEGWASRIGALGIDADSAVVVYDDNQSKDAARIWWILRYWGVSDVRLLNGGWVGWQADKLPIERDEPSAANVSPADFRASAAEDRLATKDDLIASLGRNDLQIVDTRSHQEHCGTEPLRNKRAGAIPGATHLEWSDLIDPETHRFKSATELASIFAAAGIRLDRPTATYCQSGGRASVMAFGLELMGADEVRNYYRSWAQWGNLDDTPIVTPTPRD